MADFDRYAPTLMLWEARIPQDMTGMDIEQVFAYAKRYGWSNHPYDKGGPTMVGVTLTRFREYFGADHSESDLRDISYKQWRLIMQTYWTMCQADRIENQSIAEILADWCVTSGRTAVKKMQQKLALSADGIVGPITLGCLNSPNKAVIFNRIKDARMQFYVGLAFSNPTQKVFLNGWLNRVNYFKFNP